MGQGRRAKKREAPSDERDYNFSRWKQAVGLPQSFPKLSVLTESELHPEIGMYVGYGHKQAVDAILDSMANPRVAVLVNPGHGSSTLSRYIAKESTAIAVRMARIPVRLTVDDFEDAQPDYFDVVMEKIRDAAVRNLVLLPWERVLTIARYGGLIGITGRGTLDPQRLALAAEMGVVLARGERLPEDQIVLPAAPIKWDRVRELAPRLAVAPEALLADLAEQYDIGVSLQMDLSSSRHKNNSNDNSVGEPTSRPTYGGTFHAIVGKLASAVKSLHEREVLRPGSGSQGSGGRARSRINIMLFTSEEGLDTFTAEWEQSFDKIDYPLYGPPDVFTILSYHYPQKLQGSGILRTQAMALVLSDELVFDAYRSDRSLHSIIAELERKCLDLMGDWEKVRIRLEKARQPDAGAST